MSSTTAPTVLTTATGRAFVRTPESCFRDLSKAGWTYEPRYVTVDGGMRMHYVDEGNRNGPVVLLLHGQPDWCFLYRHMIPILVAGGCRAIAPDMIGMGRSDKPTDVVNAHTVEAHLAWWLEFIDALQLEEITLFCQDWGGCTGLRVVAARPDLFARVCASNTGLPLCPDPMIAVEQGSIDRRAFPVDAG